VIGRFLVGHPQVTYVAMVNPKLYPTIETIVAITMTRGKTRTTPNGH
jgi:hypothetical protein